MGMNRKPEPITAEHVGRVLCFDDGEQRVIEYVGSRWIRVAGGIEVSVDAYKTRDLVPLPLPTDSAHLRAREQRDMHSQTPLLTNAEHTAIATLIASLSKGRT